MVSNGDNEGNWRSYIALGGLILTALFLPSKGKRQKTSENHNHPTKGSNDPAKPMPPSHKYDHYTHPSEEEHRTAEQFYWGKSNVLNIFITIFAAVAAFFAAGSYCESRRQADIAAKSLIATNRAWINVEGDFRTLSLSWSKKSGVNATLLMSAINEGNSPALNVEFEPILLISGQYPTESFVQQAKDKCVRIGNSGNIIFMKNDPSGSDQTSDYEIFGISPSAFTPSLAKDFYNSPKLGTPPYSVYLNLALCASYQVVGDASIHYTIKFFNLQQNFVANNVMSANVPKINVNLGPGTVPIQKSSDSDYAD